MNRFPLNRVLVGTLLLPTVFGALVLWSMGDRAESTHRVPAAVVNLDKPVTTGTGADKKVVYAGRLLAGGLTSPEDPADTTLGWRLAGAAEAEKGLRNGDYYAVVTIPRDFSATLAKLSGPDATQAGVTLQTNDASSAVVGEASKQVTAIATARLGQTITSTYLQGVTARTGTLKSQLGDAADGAGKLAEGTTRLRQGAGQLDGGATELATGLVRLSDGAGELADGAHRLSTGAGKLHDGTGALAGGLGTLSRRTDPLPSQTRRLSDGVGPYTQVVKGWAQACATNPVVAGTNPQLCAGTLQAAGVGGRNADQLASGARELADAMPALTGAIDTSAAGARRLDSGAGQLASGSRKLTSGADALATGAERASTGAEQLASGSGRLADGTDRLASGSDRLATGLRTGAQQIPAPSTTQAEVVADPVASTSSRLNPERDGRTLLLPALLAIGLWLGAFVTYLVRQALPAARLRMAASGRRIALSGWLPALGTGVLQAVLLYAAALLLGADLGSPLGVAGFMLLVAGVFAAVNQAFVALCGQRRGWILSLTFAALQLVSLGGLVPIDTAPGPFRALNAVLPVARAADGFGHLVLGGQVGSFPGDVTILLLWGLGAFAVSAYAARRAQRVDVDELRSRVPAYARA